MSGAVGLVVNMAPVLHLWRVRDHRYEKVFLGSMVNSCWYAACDLGRDDVDHRYVERVLWRWATTAADTYRPDEAGGDRLPALVAAVSDRLRRAHTWLLLWGFVPVMGAVAGYLIRANAAQRCYRIARSYCEGGAIAGRAVERGRRRRDDAPTGRPPPDAAERASVLFF